MLKPANATPLLPALHVERSPPANLNLADEPLFRSVLSFDLAPTRLLEYHGVNVTPESTVWKGLSIAKELLVYPDHDTKYGYNWKYTVAQRVRRKRVAMPDDRYLLCTDYWADGYFHWLADTLPRLLVVKDLLPDSVLLMPAQYKASYYRTTLAAFDIGRILEIPMGEYFHLPHLRTPEQPTPSGEFNPALTKELRAYLLAYFGRQFTGKKTPPNIYVSRAKAKYRKVLNEPEIEPVLRKYGFETVFFEDLKMHEQMEMAAGARNVVSLHGANLTNTMFMPAGGNVLEFRKHRDTINNYYYSLADSVGLSYYYLQCDYTDPRPGHNFFDVTVNPVALEEILRQMTQ